LGGGVLIPFIAGQWSLLGDYTPSIHYSSFVLIPFIAGQWSLREGVGGAPARLRLVLIPFIAGQWSLLLNAPSPKGGVGKS